MDACFVSSLVDIGPVVLEKIPRTIFAVSLLSPLERTWLFICLYSLHPGLICTKCGRHWRRGFGNEYLLNFAISLLKGVALFWNKLESCFQCFADGLGLTDRQTDRCFCLLLFSLIYPIFRAPAQYKYQTEEIDGLLTVLPPPPHVLAYGQLNHCRKLTLRGKWDTPLFDVLPLEINN